jgi:hypothetical protein
MTSTHQASHVVRPTAPKQPTRRRPKQEPFQFGQVLQPKDDLIGGYIVEHDRKQIRIDKNAFERIEQLAGPQRHMPWKMGQWGHCVEEFLRVRSTRFGWRAERRAPYGRWAAGKNCASPWSRPPCCFLLLRRPWPPRNFFSRPAWRFLGTELVQQKLHIRADDGDALVMRQHTHLFLINAKTDS